MDPILAYLGPLAGGVALAAVAGLRAFLPLFALGLAARLDWLPLAPGFAWLESTPALVALGSAVLLELLGDKFPAVDHLLDLAGTVIRPAAGIVSVMALTTGLDPMWAAVLALLVGGGVAGTVHLAKAKTRVGSSLLSAGLANPLVSLAEDVASFVGAALAVLWPFVALAFLAAAGLAAWAAFRLARRLARRARATSAA